MLIHAYDLSLTATGWATTVTSAPAVVFGVFTDMPRGLIGIPRLDWIARRVAGHCRGATLVVMEDMSFGSKGGSIDQIAGMHYLIRHTLWNRGTPYVLLAPTTLKKFVTGKGNSEKSLIIKEVFRRWNLDCDSDNSADACGLLMAGLGLVGDYQPTSEQQRAVLSDLQKKFPTEIRIAKEAA